MLITKTIRARRILTRFTYINNGEQITCKWENSVEIFSKSIRAYSSLRSVRLAALTLRKKFGEIHLIDSARLGLADTFFNLPCEELFNMSDNKFVADYAKRGQASCKKCRGKLEKGCLRLGKIVPNPFSDSGENMKTWYHPTCLFDTFVRARATTKVVEDAEDIEGFNDLSEDDQLLIKKLIDDLGEKRADTKVGNGNKLEKVQSTLFFDGGKIGLNVKPLTPATCIFYAADELPDSDEASDNYFLEFRSLVARVAAESSYNVKTRIIQKFLSDGTDGEYKGDTYLFVKLLLPGVVKRVYNLNNRSILKHFSSLFDVDQTHMQTHFEEGGDISDTVKVFFEKSRTVAPRDASFLSIQKVDALLQDLTQFAKEDEQQDCLRKIAKLCTTADLKVIIRLVKHDLRMNAGAKHVMEALHPMAYEAFQASRDLKDVVERVIELRGDAKLGIKKQLTIEASLMIPVLPMLAEACKSVSYAFKKCPNGMYSEIKYDGERVQVHKSGEKFQFYSRSLKPVLPHKVHHFKHYIPLAFPGGEDLIIDSEVLLIDTKTGKPLPFGTLGVHKKQAFKDANVCLFVFDCLYYNGESLMHKPLRERRKFLHRTMKEIDNHIMFSEMQHITEPRMLKDMMIRVFEEGLEGLVVKDIMSTYEPGKRHWLKLKKDYLLEGAMADSADLVVLGAYHGTGSKGGMMSVFLMGVYDENHNIWLTVTKCGNGHDDKTLERLQKELDVEKINKDYSKVPDWLRVSKSICPDFVVKSPKKAPVWEIQGAEFSQSDAHTADGISIRFPRVTKIRDDKGWEEATSLKQLQELYRKSKEHSDIAEFLGGQLPRQEEDDGGHSDNRRDLNSDPSEDNGNERLDLVDATSRSISRDITGTEMILSGNQQVLPDVFTGMRFHLPSSLADHLLLRRYIVAFDGQVVPTFDRALATHLVSDEECRVRTDVDVPVPVSTVRSEWLWRCIQERSLVPLQSSESF